MATLLRMPGVSADADEAVLESWNTEAGATIKRGDAIASVETEKAVVDIEAESDSVVHTLLVEGGSTVAVGDPIAVLLDKDEDASAAEALLAQIGHGEAAAQAPAAEPAEAGDDEPEHTGDGPAMTSTAVAEAEDMAAPSESPAAPAPAQEEKPQAPATEPATRADGERIFASPLARRLAQEAGLELADIPGTGPVGRITKKDVEAAVKAKGAEPSAAAAPAKPEPAAEPPAVKPAAAEAAPADGSSTPHSRLRKTIARRLQSSKQNAPHFYVTRHLQLDALLELRALVNAGSPVRISVNDFIVKAAALALRDVPEVNVVWTDEAMIGFDHSDVAVAVASDRGLVTPVMRNVEQKSLSTLSAEIKNAVTRANEGKLQLNDLEGGTMTVSNLGMFGVDEFSAILNPPQSTILAVGAGKPRPVVTADGELAVATVASFTLSVDHRAVDGALAGQFMQRFADLIESPMQLLI